MGTERYSNTVDFSPILWYNAYYITISFNHNMSGTTTQVSDTILEESYLLRRMNYKFHEIVKKTGYKNVWIVLHNIDRYIANWNEYQHKNNNYTRVINKLITQGMIILPEQAKAVEAKVQEKPQEQSPYIALQYSFDKFMESVGAFIEHEVNRKSNEVRKELEAQKKINKELLTAVEEAKHSNWITSLQKRFQ